MPDLFSKLLHPAALFAWTLAFLAMRTLMIDLGVAADRLVLERKSRNAGENATATARIVAAKGWGSRPRVLVTSAIHMPRAFATFRKAGLEACAFAAERRWDSIDPVTAWIPDSYTLLQSLATMREVAALARYAASGRLQAPPGSVRYRTQPGPKVLP